MSDTTPPDVSTAAAVDAPADHPVLEVRPSAGDVPEGVPKEPDEFMAALLDGFESVRLEDSHGQDVLRIDRSEYGDLIARAKESGFENCADVTVVDWYRHRRTRFELVLNLLSHQHRRRLRVLVPIPSDEPSVASATPLWPGASFGEREAFDMYGVDFEGHPDLTRILMPDEWEGFPLRKDFGTGSVPVQFKESHKAT